jgi:hypothetical protein
MGSVLLNIGLLKERQMKMTKEQFEALRHMIVSISCGTSSMELYIENARKLLVEDDVHKYCWGYVGHVSSSIKYALKKVFGGKHDS